MPTAREILELVAKGIENGPAAIRPDDGRGPGRPWSTRRPFAERNDPWAYARDILGVVLTPQQEILFEAFERSDRVLCPSGNNVGKTHSLACYAWYRYDAVASLPDERRGLEEQGCILLLPGPDHGTIFDTIYGQMLELAQTAADRGHPMPGRISDKSASMRVGPRWFGRAFSPKHTKGRKVAHTASGRHHQNMIGVLEEGAGVLTPVWLATEGMCSADGNKIISSFNPTEASGAAWERAHPPKGGERIWEVVHLSALDHVNVVQRRTVIGGAISHKRIEARIRVECDVRGTLETVTPEPDKHDFLYALPEMGQEDRPGPRADGIPGHPDAEVKVFRPGIVFTAQGLGQWPSSSLSGLFDAAAWDRATRRWSESRDPLTPPDRIGVDAAREGEDDTVTAPCWGHDAEYLLGAWREIMASVSGARAAAVEDEPEIPPAENVEEFARWLGTAEAQRVIKGEKPARPRARMSAEQALEKVRAKHRIRLGVLEVVPKGSGPSVATWIARRYPDSPLNVDEGGVGASVYDHLAEVLMCPAAPVVFGGSPGRRLPNEQHFENLRTQMYMRFAALVRLDLIDLPPDPMLRQEAFAHQIKHRTKSVAVDGRRKVRSTVYLDTKDSVKEEIGRSPDRMDAAVLALLPYLPRVIDLT